MMVEAPATMVIRPWIFPFLSLALLCPSVAFAQNSAPTTPDNPPDDTRPAPSPTNPGPAPAAKDTGIRSIVRIDPASDQAKLLRQETERPGTVGSDAMMLSPREVYSEDWWSHARPIVEIHGYFRTRGELYHNFSLNRHESPTRLDGQNLWAQPIDNTYQDTTGATRAVQLCGQPPYSGCSNNTQSTANMRLRLSPELHISDNLRIVTQVDLLDIFGEGQSTRRGTDDERERERRLTALEERQELTCERDQQVVIGRHAAEGRVDRQLELQRPRRERAFDEEAGLQLSAGAHPALGRPSTLENDRPRWQHGVRDRGLAPYAEQLRQLAGDSGEERQISLRSSEQEIPGHELRASLNPTRSHARWRTPVSGGRLFSRACTPNSRLTARTGSQRGRSSSDTGVVSFCDGGIRPSSGSDSGVVFNTSISRWNSASASTPRGATQALRTTKRKSPRFA